MANLTFKFNFGDVILSLRKVWYGRFGLVVWSGRFVRQVWFIKFGSYGLVDSVSLVWFSRFGWVW